MIPRKLSGVVLAALLVIAQAGPLTAAICGARAMDCCNGKMCPMTKKSGTPHHANTDCGAMQNPGKSSCCCSASPCQEIDTPTIHASVYLVAPVTNLSAASPRVPLEIVRSLVHPKALSVPDSPPPRTLSI